MRVRDLIAALENYDEDTEVLVAQQPSWPLQFVLSGVVSTEDLAEEGYLDEEAEPTEEAVLYLVAGEHPHKLGPYAPSAVFEFQGVGRY